MQPIGDFTALISPLQIYWYLHILYVVQYVKVWKDYNAEKDLWGNSRIRGRPVWLFHCQYRLLEIKETESRYL